MTAVPSHIAGKKKPRVSALPPFPPVARKLMALVAQENVNIQEVSRLVRSDAVFTAEVLRLANSAVLGLRYEVVNILHAVSVLGMDRIRALVLTVAMRDFFSTLKHDELLRRCWRHNLACALTAEWAADACWFDKSVAYTGGLLHSLGHLGMCALYPDEYLDSVESSFATGEPLLAAEQARTGTDHVHLACWLVKEWGLPGQFAALSRCHHMDEAIEPTQLPGLMALCCETADMLGFPIAGPPAEWSPEHFLGRLPEASRWKLSARLNELPELVPYRLNVFEVEFLT